MPADPKPLFRPEVVRPRAASVLLPPDAARQKLADWAARLADPTFVREEKETAVLPGFLQDVFEGVLGYTRPPAAGYTLKREALVQVDGKFADAALGRFGAGDPVCAVAVEGKGPADPLDRPHAGRKRSAVSQAMEYAVQLPADWYAVTNLKETRLYAKSRPTDHFERFRTADLAADERELRRFVFLLGAGRVVGPAGNHLGPLLDESRKAGRDLTAAYYREYRDLRRRTFDALRTHNPGRDPRALLGLTQKLLDRVLFVAFCEDRGLLPAESIAGAFAHRDRYNARPAWENFKVLFRWVDEGNPGENIPRYNGGLFKIDLDLESLVVPDDVCAGFKALADYEYNPAARSDGKLVDVDILGHVFEQSITDLEEIGRELAGGPADGGPSKRKREGAFYTPDAVTRYVVGQTLGPVLADRFEALRQARQQAATGTAVKALDDPRVFDASHLNEPQRRALVGFWRAWQDDLQTVRVVDPSCGSGAFLVEAFDQLQAAYREADGFQAALGAGTGMVGADIISTILTDNLFGVDLNGEAVGIARLSFWVKTAQPGQVLTALDKNIVRGNSVVAENRPPLDAWQDWFPEVMKGGGFDVVVGNPPYVRQEWIKDDKPYLKQHYRAYDGVADLYVYFYELGLNLLTPGGRLGYVVTNKWMKAGYGEPLRRLYGAEAWVETVVDLGHNKEVFPDADVFPCVLTVRKPSNILTPPHRPSLLAAPRTHPAGRPVGPGAGDGGDGPAGPVRGRPVDPGAPRRRRPDGQAACERRPAPGVRRGRASVRREDRLQRSVSDRHADERQAGRRGPRVRAVVPAVPAGAGRGPVAGRVVRAVDDCTQVERQPRLAVGEGRGRGRGGRPVPAGVPGPARPHGPVPGRADRPAGPGRTLVGTPGLRLLGPVRPAEGDVPGHHLESAVLPRHRWDAVEQHGLFPADGRPLGDGGAQRPGLVVVRLADGPARQGRGVAPLHRLPQRVPDPPAERRTAGRGRGGGRAADRHRRRAAGRDLGRTRLAADRVRGGQAVAEAASRGRPRRRRLRGRGQEGTAEGGGPVVVRPETVAGRVRHLRRAAAAARPGSRRPGAAGVSP